MSDAAKWLGRPFQIEGVVVGGERLGRQGEGPRVDELIRGGHSRVVEVEGRRLFADVFGPPPRLGGCPSG